MTTLTEFLFPAPARRSLGGIVLWWEERRIAYNVLVGAGGLFSLGIGSVVRALPPGPRAPFMPWQGVLAFGVLANLCYLLGPTTEAIFQLLWGRSLLPVGPALFRIGLTFSMGLALLPTLVVFLDWGFRIVHAIF